MCNHPTLSPNAMMTNTTTPATAAPANAPPIRRGVARVRTATVIRMTQLEASKLVELLRGGHRRVCISNCCAHKFDRTSILPNA
jgi:hypothetical protein